MINFLIWFYKKSEKSKYLIYNQVKQGEAENPRIWKAGTSNNILLDDWLIEYQK